MYATTLFRTSKRFNEAAAGFKKTLPPGKKMAAFWLQSAARALEMAGIEMMKVVHADDAP